MGNGGQFNDWIEAASPNRPTGRARRPLRRETQQNDVIDAGDPRWRAQLTLSRFGQNLGMTFPYRRCELGG